MAERGQYAHCRGLKWQPFSDDVSVVLSDNRVLLGRISRYSVVLFKNTRDVVVYVPPPYIENAHASARWDTLVMSDGENIFNDTTSFQGVSWRAQETLDELIISGKMIPVVVLAPYNTAERMAEYTPINGSAPDTAAYCQGKDACGEADHYLDWIETTLLPLASADLRVSFENLGLLGSSLGGLLSFYACWTRTMYKRCGCMSSSFWWNGNWTLHSLVSSNATFPSPSKDTLFYLDSGTPGDDDVQTVQIRDAMVQRGYMPIRCLSRG